MGRRPHDASTVEAVLPVPRLRSTLLLPVASGLVALVVYLATAAPGITWRNGGIDSGELATAVATGSVAHPPGYPTYLLVGAAVTRLTADPARALAWLSAVCGAVTVACVAAAASRGGSGWTGAVTGSAVALIIGTSFLLWSNSTYAEVNAPAAAVVGVWLVTQGWRSRPAGWLALEGVALGLALGIHMLLGILLVGTAAGVVIEAPRGKGPAGRLLALAGGAVVGAAVFGALGLWPPAGPVNWYAPQMAAGWLALVTADAYRGLLDFGGAPLRLLVMLRQLVGNLAFLGAIAAVIGTQEVLARKADRWKGGTLLCTGLALPYVIFASLYAARDAEVYLLPALVLLTPAMATGCRAAAIQLRSVMTRYGPALFASIALAPGAIQGLRQVNALNLSGDHQAASYAEAVLSTAPRDGVVLVDGDAATFALWYARYARGVRPDVAVLNEDLLYRDWYRAHVGRLHPLVLLPEFPAIETERTALAQRITAANAGRFTVVLAPEPQG